MYTVPTNKYNVSCLAFVDKYPKEFISIIKPDYEKMFEKIVQPAVERFYECVKWRSLDMRNQVTCDLLDLLGE